MKVEKLAGVERFVESAGKALALLFPNGIEPKDYTAAVRVVGAWRALRKSLEAPGPKPSNKLLEARKEEHREPWIIDNCPRCKLTKPVTSNVCLPCYLRTPHLQDSDMPTRWPAATPREVRELFTMARRGRQ